MTDSRELMGQAVKEIRGLRQRVRELEATHNEPIAIVGMGCRLPGDANDPQSFWRLLHDGVDTIREVPADRWNVDAYYDPDPHAPGKVYVRSGGFLRQIDGFDPEFFRISPREARNLGPQQRLLLEVTWEALENANIVPGDLFGGSTGVFIGQCGFDDGAYTSGPRHPEAIDHFSLTGSTMSIAANRLSYLLGVTGPSVTVDTACSSSLVAVHLACQSLRLRECDQAIAGGAHVMLSPSIYVGLSRLEALSPDGRCKSFDASANGFARGEGSGLVVLMRLADAQANNHRILAVIRGSAVNQDGASGGLTVPSGPSQEAVIQRALKNAAMQPADIGYVEAHGTGTSLGDPLEMGALHVVYDAHSRERPLLVGSVKANIGHLEGAAGIAGLLKAVLALQHRTVPPNLHFKQPNPLIPWASIAVEVPTEPRPFPQRDGPLAAGISSFGLGGTNAHVIVTEAPVGKPAERVPAWPEQILVVSGQRATAIGDAAVAFEALLASDPAPDLAAVCRAAATCRTHFDHRAALTASTAPAMRDKLGALARGESTPGIFTGQSDETRRPKVAFLFTGQGAQHPGMGAELYESQSTFREALDRCAEVLEPLMERPLLEVLHPADADDTSLHQTGCTQPALFALEYALAQMWMSWGVKFDVVLGHSVGEYVAAHLAGVFGLEDALQLIAARGRLMQSLPEGGGMVTAFAAREKVTPALHGLESKLAVAAHNGPENTVLSGDLDALRVVTEQLQQDGIRCRPLRVSHAFHSPLMAPIEAEFARIVAGVRLSRPRAALISNLSGQLADAQLARPEYWVRHMRQPVQFFASIRTLVENDEGGEARPCMLLELGPRPSLLAMAQDSLGVGDSHVHCVPSLDPKKGDRQQVAEGLAALHARGVHVDWNRYHGGSNRTAVTLPTYPFQRDRYAYTIDEGPAAAAPEAESFRDWLYSLEWRDEPTVPRREAAEAPPTGGTWIVFADEQIGPELRRALQARGDSCAMVDGDDAEDGDYGELFARLAPAGIRGVIHLRGLDATSEQIWTRDTLELATRQSCGSALRIAQTLVTSALGAEAGLWIVTRGAVRVGDDQPLAVAQAPLWGLGKVIAREHPECFGGLVDLDPATDVRAGVTALLREITAPDGEDLVAHRNGRRQVARLVRSADRTSRTAPLACRADGTYLITGGLGGIGLQLASRLVERGARNLALLGRRPPSESAQTALQQLQQQGCRVQTFQADVAQHADLKRALAEIGLAMPKLAGVIHAAGVIDRAILLQQTWERFLRIFGTKVFGSWNLHELTRDHDLDFFVLFSTAATVVGSEGQANYAAGNAFLDALAHQRRALGLPATSINWGMWREVGAAVEGDTVERIGRTGVGAMASAPALDALEWAVQRKHVQPAVMAIDWPRFLQQRGTARMQRFFDELSDELPAEPPLPTAAADAAAAAAAAAGGGEALRDLPVGERSRRLREVIAAELKQVLEFDATRRIDDNQGFFQMGMDSLTTLQLRTRLMARLQMSFPATFVFDHPTVQQLATRLEQEIGGATATEPATAEPRVDARATRPKTTGSEPDGDIGESLDRELDDIDDLLGDDARGSR